MVLTGVLFFYIITIKYYVIINPKIRQETDKYLVQALAHDIFLRLSVSHTF